VDQTSKEILWVQPTKQKEGGGERERGTGNLGGGGPTPEGGAMGGTSVGRKNKKPPEKKT